MPDARRLPLPESTDVVTHVIKVDGERLPMVIQVLGIAVQKEVNRISAATLIFNDGDASAEGFELSSKDLFVPGAEVEVMLGYQSTEDTVFKGVVTKQSLRLTRSGVTTLTVECRDKAVAMTLERRCRYFEQVTDAEAAAEIADAYGLDASFAATDVTHAELVQYDSTDWDYVISRLEANGHICLVDDGAISGAAPDTGQEPVLTLTFGATMYEFDAEIDARGQPTAIKSVSWDPTAQEVVEGEAEEPGVPETGNLSSGSLADSLGQGRRIQHSGRLPADEVQAWANAALLRNRLSKVRGRTSFQGLPDVKPGQFIELQGVGDRFSGPVFVSGVHHRVADGAWTTDVQFGLCSMPFIESMTVNKPPASSLIPAIQGLQVGLVTSLEGDPEGEPRVQVRLPVIDAEAAGVWARVSTLDAGDQRGSFFLPEVEDEVLVGFINDDPRDAVILGMLHSGAKPPPFEAADDNHEKGYVSRSGMQLRFHDDEKSVTISTPEGNQILLSEDASSVQIDHPNGSQILLDSNGVSISAEGDLNLSATGDVSISASNVTLEAQSAFAASGSSGAELTSDGSTTVKGSVVMIN